MSIRQLSTQGLSVGRDDLINAYFLFHACRRTRGDWEGGGSAKIMSK